MPLTRAQLKDFFALTRAQLKDFFARTNKTREKLDELAARYVEPDPLKRGAERARIADHGVSIWALISYLEGVDGDLGQVARDYELSRDALIAALWYYSQHKAVVDAQVLLNRASFGDERPLRPASLRE
jgi:uncharacterized protein (DUF433 family)